MKKSVAKNYIYNLAYQMLVLILPLITTPYVSKVLGAAGIGIYSYTLSIATYFILFGSLGIAMYGQREIAYIRDNLEKKSLTFWEIVIVRLSTMSISLLLYILIFANGENYNVYYKILIIELIANALDISWFFQGLEEFKKTVIRNTIVKIISVICIFTIIKNSTDLWLYILIYAVSNLLGNLSLWMYLPKYLKKVRYKELNFKKHILPIISLFIPQIAMQVYLVVDKTMLGNILGDMSEVGNYEQSQKIIKTALTVVTALGTVVAPRIANIISNNDKKEVEKYLENSFRFVWLLGLPIMLGLIATSRTIVPWFLGVGYEKSISLVMIGAPLIIAIGLSNVTGIQFLIPAKKQKAFTKSVVIGAILNFVLNLIFIPYFKSAGALTASIIAELAIVIVQLLEVKKDIDIRIILNNVHKYLISAIIMFIPVYIFGLCQEPTIITTFIQVILGGLIYGLILIVLKDSFVLDKVEVFKEKILKNNKNDKV